MAQTSTPARARPWAPVTRKECPLTLADESGADVGTFNRLAASTMVSDMASLLTTSPEDVGKSGRSRSGTPSVQRVGNNRSSRCS